jgi:hypothetical protein
MKLHRPVAHAGSSGPVDRAGSPACRGSNPGKLKADRLRKLNIVKRTQLRQTLIAISLLRHCVEGFEPGGSKTSQRSRLLPSRRGRLPYWDLRKRSRGTSGTRQDNIFSTENVTNAKLTALFQS